MAESMPAAGFHTGHECDGSLGDMGLNEVISISSNKQVVQTFIFRLAKQICHIFCGWVQLLMMFTVQFHLFIVFA
jgi:hypothetical protein